MNYQQLTEGKRYQISALLRQEISVANIARTLNCHRATIYRELRKGQRTKVEVIKNKVSIDERPAIVEKKKRFGDWEIDTVLGKHGTGSIVTLLERKTRFYLIKKVDSKSAKDVTQATIELLMPFRDRSPPIMAESLPVMLR